MSMRIVLMFTLSFFLHTTYAQEIQQKLPEKTRVLFLLDGSGSMLASWEDTHRMQAAKDLLSDLVDSLKADPRLELALRVYGHLYSKKAQNCKETRLEIGFSKNNHDQVISKLQLVKPKGTTPIAYSLEQAAKDFPTTGGYRNIVIIITDGIESCDGDPCAVSLALQEKGIFLKPFIIGMGMGQNFREEFQCIGEFYDARDQASFKKALDEAINTSLKTTTVSVELLDERDRPTETNVNVSFVNNFTKIPVFDFVHYRDQQGRPDTVEIDPVLSYDIIVNTIPPVYKRGTRLNAGGHNVISINAPQGILKITQKGASSYRNGVSALVKDKRGRVVHVQPANSSEKYLAGNYRLELLTLPRQYFDIEIKPRQAKSIALPSPGILNINNTSRGYGSIYTILENGIQEWVCDLDNNEPRSTLALQPGDYKVVFRANAAPGSKYTAIKTVRVKEGLSQLVKIF